MGEEGGGGGGEAVEGKGEEGEGLGMNKEVTNVVAYLKTTKLSPGVHCKVPLPGEIFIRENFYYVVVRGKIFFCTLATLRTSCT